MVQGIHVAESNDASCTLPVSVLYREEAMMMMMICAVVRGNAD